MDGKVIAVLETLLHADNLAEHLLSTLSLQVPQSGEILPQHPDRLYGATADAPGLNMGSLAIVTFDKAEYITLGEFAQRLWDPVTKLMELRLDDAIKDDTDIEVRENNAVGFMLFNFHLGQELFNVLESESLEE